MQSQKIRSGDGRTFAVKTYLRPAGNLEDLKDAIKVKLAARGTSAIGGYEVTHFFECAETSGKSDERTRTFGHLGLALVHTVRDDLHSMSPSSMQIVAETHDFDLRRRSNQRFTSASICSRHTFSLPFSFNCT